MASISDAVSLDSQGKESKVRRFDSRDFQYMAETVIEDFQQRQKDRAEREKHWKDIDRQVAMTPDDSHKKLPNGEPDKEKMWMAAMELPLQAQTLEVTTADARRFMFPGSGSWYRAHAETTDDYLENIDFQSLILGDKTEVPSQIDQIDADHLVGGFVMSGMRQYDFQSRMDRVNAEVMKYGMGVARARMMRKSVYIHEARGTRLETQMIPVFCPVSIKNLYLECEMPSMHTSTLLGQSPIARDYIRLEKLQYAANRGKSDPDDEDGGWMPEHLKMLEADKDGYVTLLEYEGDMVVPRKTVRSLIVPGIIVTVALGGKSKGGNVTQAVVRLRFRKKPYSSYLLFPYHYEGADDTYASSPLEKGRPVQIMATDALNRLMDSAALKNAPPIGYDKSNMTFGAQGGPVISPFAIWETIDGVQVHDKVGGDPSALVNVFRTAVNLYAELTGILPARLGAQTVSHTTAFAKDAELLRGAVRTVDYVNDAGQGALTRWLHMAYDMGRDAVPSNGVSFFIDAFGGYVKTLKRHLPEKATFEWFGAGGPSEEQAKTQRMFSALQVAIQMDNLKLQQDQIGASGTINLDAAIRETLRQGGWTDVDAIVQAAQQVQQPVAGAGNPGAEAVALQQLGIAAAQ